MIDKEYSLIELLTAIVLEQMREPIQEIINLLPTEEELDLKEIKK